MVPQLSGFPTTRPYRSPHWHKANPGKRMEPGASVAEKNFMRYFFPSHETIKPNCSDRMCPGISILDLLSRRRTDQNKLRRSIALMRNLRQVCGIRGLVCARVSEIARIGG